jgi:hypothetical protein
MSPYLFECFYDDNNYYIFCETTSDSSGEVQTLLLEKLFTTFTVMPDISTNGNQETELVGIFIS